MCVTRRVSFRKLSTVNGRIRAYGCVGYFHLTLCTLIRHSRILQSSGISCVRSTRLSGLAVTIVQMQAEASTTLFLFFAAAASELCDSLTTFLLLVFVALRPWTTFSPSVRRGLLLASAKRCRGLSSLL